MMFMPSVKLVSALLIIIRNIRMIMKKAFII